MLSCHPDFFLLPTDIHISILQEWVIDPMDGRSMAALGLLDIACCNTMARRQYLEILGLLTFPLSPVQEKRALLCRDMVSYFHWLNSRSVAVRSLCIAEVNLAKFSRHRHEGQIPVLMSSAVERLTIGTVNVLQAAKDELDFLRKYLPNIHPKELIVSNYFIVRKVSSESLVVMWFPWTLVLLCTMELLCVSLVLSCVHWPRPMHNMITIFASISIPM